MRPNRFRSRPPAACPSEADGRLCRNARLPDMCERPRANAKAALGMDRAPSFFTMSNSPLRGLLVPRSTFSGLSPSATHLRCCRRFGGLAPNPWSLHSDPEEGWAERRQAHYLRLSRLRDATSALARRGASHATGTLASRRSTVAFSARGRASGSPALPPDPCSEAPRSQAIVHGGRRPGPPDPRFTSRGRRTPLPAPPSGSSPETPLHERGWESCTIYSLRSQYLNSFRSRKVGRRERLRANETRPRK